MGYGRRVVAVEGDLVKRVVSLDPCHCLCSICYYYVVKCWGNPVRCEIIELNVPIFIGEMVKGMCILCNRKR